MGTKPGAVVLIHGAWHDSWCWSLVGDLLTAAGLDWIAPDLPMLSLRADDAIIREITSDPDRDYVLVGHSRGGRLMSFSSFGRANVKHLIYLASDVQEAGRADMDDRTPVTLSGKAIVPAADGFTVIDKDYAAEFFYGDCDPGLTATAIGHLRPTRTQTDADVAGMDVGWKTIPSTYILGAQDRCMHPDDQRRVAKRTCDVVELQASHSAMMSMPGDVTGIIVERARRAGIVQDQGNDH